MFNAEELRVQFEGLVGFRQNRDPDGVRVEDEKLTSSLSGIWFDNQHPLMALNALEAVAPEFDLWQYEEWWPGTYERKMIVSREGELWVSRVMTDEEPGEAAQDWDLFEPFTEWLKDSVGDSTIQVLNDWLVMKGLQGSSANLLSRNVFYPEGPLEPMLDANRGKVVGLQMWLPNSRGLVADVSRIGIQVEMAELFSIYLWRSDQPNGPVRSLNVSVSEEEQGQLKWLEVGWELKAGPVWYITYDQSELVGRSVNAIEPGSIYVNRFPAGRYLGVSSCEGGIAARLPGRALEGLSTNFGINIDATVRCDYTEFLVSSKRQFADVIAKGVTLDLLSKYLWNPSSRTNRHVDGVDKGEVRYDKHGEAMGRPSGLEYKYRQALKTLAFDRSHLDPVCLPCRSNGIEFGVT